jgi:aminoglycoside N3'-acetyltransferase
MINAPTVTRHDMLSGLQRLGVKPGMRLIVHSSLSSFGTVDGGAPAVIAALSEAVTPEGLLLMPSFNHYVPFRRGGPGIYDPATTPTTNGVIPETFRTMPGVWRSLNPSHAYACRGNGAEELLRDHHLTLTMGPDSPLGRLGREGGYCLMLGTDYHTNTYKHVVETTTGAPCLGRRTLALPVRLPDSRVVRLRTWTFRASPCPIMDPDEHAEREMSRRGLHRRTQVGNARLTLFRLSDCFEVLASMLRDGYAGHPPCSRCPIRPGVGPGPVPSDWDDAAGGLNDDARAHAVGPMAYCSFRR